MVSPINLIRIRNGFSIPLRFIRSGLEIQQRFTLPGSKINWTELNWTELNW
jgi:hypothetical protein